MDYKISGNELIIVGTRINERLIIPDGQDPEAWAAQYVSQLVDVEPTKPVEIHIRKIRQDAFLDRFTPTEQGRIEASADITLRVFKNNAIVVVRPYINLDHGLVQYALPILRDGGILDGDTEEERQARMDAILADGTEDEAKGITI